MVLRVAVIGAGMAGLKCASLLQERGHEVVVYDKGRSLGGRCATRPYSTVAFDHGAQYVTAHTPAFQAYMDEAVSKGSAALWKPADADNLQQNFEGQLEPWFVGTPGMTGLVQPLSEGLTVSHIRILDVQRRDGQWWLEPVNEAFDALVLAVPAPQALPFLGEHAFSQRVQEAEYAPCWAGMLEFDTRVPGPDVLRFEAGNLAWAARNTSKPERGAHSDGWVLHTSPAWSHANIDRDRTEIASEFYGMLTAAMGKPLPPPSRLVAHLWRYARVEKALGEDYLWDAEQKLGVCGDYCLGARVEAAFTSGAALGAVMAEGLAQT